MPEVVANARIPEKFRMVEEGEERYDMCKAFEDMRQEGIKEKQEEIKMPILSANRIGGVRKDNHQSWEHPLWSGCFSYVKYNIKGRENQQLNSDF